MKLLVALDGSDKDAALVSQAGRLARAANAEVVLVHALSPWLDPPEATAPFLDDRLAQVRGWREAYLQEQATALAGVPVQVRVAWYQWPAGGPSEDAAGCLARVAGECGADLLLVASKRASGLGGLLLGSTAQALLRRSPCPVLVVRPPDIGVDHAAATAA
jgi:nucleotide-binding universal stress UspA family protein